MTKEQKKLAWQKYYMANREKLLMQAKVRYEMNKDAITPAQRKKKQNYLKKYYQRNQEKWQEWKRKNRDRINAAKRQAYRDRPEIRNYYLQQAKNWKANNPTKAMAQRLRAYGLTIEEFNEILRRQGGGCAVCGMKANGKRLSVDHCHDSNKVRGILCSRCNFGIGSLQDSPALLMKAAAYLRKANRRC